jgi:hypothetical protein
LRVARLSYVDPVIAATEPVVAPLADNRFRHLPTGFVLDRDQGGFSFARVLELEARIELCLPRLGFD